MTRFFLLGIIVLISFIANGQKVLKKKEVQSKLELIAKEIEIGDYESAMNNFYNKNEIIQKEYVSKNMLDSYQNISTILKQKKDEFDSNKDTVETYKKYYDSKKYCEATELLSMNLTCYNSYKESQDVQKKLESELIEAKQKCEYNNSKLAEYESLYELEEYEQIYPLLEISKSEKNYYNLTDINRLEKLQKELLDKYAIYTSVKEKIITTPESKINEIKLIFLTYEESEKLIAELNNTLYISENEIKKIAGNNPILISEIKNTKNRIEKKIAELQKFSVSNKPLTRGEISQIIFGNNSISLEFIEKNCLPANKEIYFIYDLNVFAYYQLYDYDTDLKKEMFKKTPEYQNDLIELKSKRTEMFQSVYFVQVEELFLSIDYDIKKKGFDIVLHQNMGMGTAAAIPPKSVTIDFGFLSDFHIQLKSLPSRQVPDEFFGEGVANEKIFISVSEIDGIEIEENREDILVYFLFTPITRETIKFKYLCMTYGWYNMTNQVITSNKVRMIVANKETDKIYFDRIY